MSVACCLHDRWYVKSDRALPDMGSPTAAAFRTEDVGDLGARYIALICDPKLPTRVDIVPALQQLRAAPLMIPVDIGPVPWAPKSRHCRVIIFAEPEGKRLIRTAEENFAPWTEPEILATVVAPLLGLLIQMEQAGITHRAIRADNLFVAGQGTQRRITLHECVSVPPAFDQPPGYLTIEDSTADPPGRSKGSIADELYALGVLILHLLTGRLPGDGVNADALLEAKLQNGSYDTLVGGAMLPAASTELLRGLLADRRAERWTIADIAGWLDGKKRPVRAAHGGRAHRPWELEGKKFGSVPAFVHWLVGADERLVSRALRHEELIPWLSAALANPRAIERLKTALSSGEGYGRESASLVSRVAIILDPSGPIRYQRIACAVDGIGAEIAAYLHQGAAAELKLLTELITARLPQFCAANQTEVPNKMGEQAFVVEQTCRYLSDSRLGNGIERAGYDLVPGLHCLSPLIERRFVDTIADLLPALETAVADGSFDGWPIDRHIAAFIAARSRESVDSQLGALSHGDLASRWGATTRLLANIQEQSGPAALPGLCKLMAGLGKPLIDRFYNRATRKRIKAALPDIIKGGRLKLLAKELDDPNALERDHMAFERARAEFQGTERGLEKCDAAINDLGRYARKIGNAVSVTVATALSVGIIVVSFMAMAIF